MPHARCSHCRARRTLNKTLDDYIRPPRCRRCGKRKYRLDLYRQRVERAKGRTCTPGRGGCNGYHFPHRKGSKWCDHNPNIDRETAQWILENPPDLSDPPF